MKTTEQLINNVIGQLEGIKKMIKKDQDCLKILTQLKASKSAIENIMTKHMEKNALKCINSKTKQQNRDDLIKLIKELAKK
ncbi:MAG: metal-sensing transcriptional repressor [Candidatus Moranbacteria bacterium]|nr:metal-sensing transcriptional repressor [Candidatus Moranbacteria bacterium]